MIHIEGMGWFGSALAVNLTAQGIPFTWNDTDEAVNAWSCSTGSVYPAGDRLSVEGLHGWRAWHDEGLFPTGTVESCAFTYFQKTVPNSASYTPIPVGERLKVAPVAAYAVNVPAVVSYAREQFATARTDAPTPGQTVVVAHGFSHRIRQYVWGWAAPVKISFKLQHHTAFDGRRPMFFGRKSYFQICYAYPIPGRPGWYWAGSTLRPQKQPTKIKADGYFQRWREHFPALYEGATVTDTEPIRHGWRPRADTDTTDLTVAGGRLYFPPLWHSGVRWAPAIINKATQWITRNQ